MASRSNKCLNVVNILAFIILLAFSIATIGTAVYLCFYNKTLYVNVQTELLEKVYLAYIGLGAFIGLGSVVYILAVCCRSVCLFRLFIVFIIVGIAAMSTSVGLSLYHQEKGNEVFLAEIRREFKQNYKTDTLLYRTWNEMARRDECCGFFGPCDQFYNITSNTHSSCCRRSRTGQYENLPACKNYCATKKRVESGDINSDQFGVAVATIFEQGCNLVLEKQLSNLQYFANIGCAIGIALLILMAILDSLSIRELLKFQYSNHFV